MYDHTLHKLLYNNAQNNVLELINNTHTLWKYRLSY